MTGSPGEEQRAFAGYCDLQPSGRIGPLTKRDYILLVPTGLLEYVIPNPFRHIYVFLFLTGCRMLLRGIRVKIVNVFSQRSFRKYNAQKEMLKLKKCGKKHKKNRSGDK